jgi:hypothetical protein
MSHRHSILIRSAGRSDARALARLAALDSVPPIAGPALIAEVDGELRAALPLRGGRPIADPFAESEQVVELLRAAA